LSLILTLAFSATVTIANESTGNVVNSAPISIDGAWDKPAPKRKQRPLSNAQIIKRARKKNTRRNVVVLAKQIEVMEVSPEKVENIMVQEDQKLANDLNAAFDVE